MMTKEDHSNLDEAARLIHNVLDSHNSDITGPVLAALGQALIDLRIGERYLEST